MKLIPGAVLLGIAVMALLASAQTSSTAKSAYPTKPVRLVVGFSPGGGGYGVPHERPADEVKCDLEYDYVSRETVKAQQGYPDRA